MKINVLSLLAFAGTLILAVACASEDTTNKQEQQQETKGLTAFVIEDNATRTTADYDGSGINFYWTEGDRLWVNNTTLKQDVKNNISNVLVPNPTTTTGVKRAATAKFYFEGNFTAPSYPVRYTGKGSTVGDKVIFKATQNQPVANDASHIGESGDCGIATATKPAGSGSYRFTLDHKASYLTLLPYSTINFSTTVRVTKIKLTTDEALCGQFDFDDSGIVLSSRPAPTPANRSITLTLNGGGTDGFKISTTAKKEDNASVIVLPPGTYHNVAIEYTLYDQKTTKTAIVKREYPSLTFTPGKNKKVSTNLQMPVHIVPLGNWYTRPSTLPNLYQAFWYSFQGDPHVDITTTYAARRTASAPANICLGGLWLKKKDNIPGFSATTLPPGITGIGDREYSVPIGVPANTYQYFFLPSVLSNGANGIECREGWVRYWVGPAQFESGGTWYTNVQRVLASTYYGTYATAGLGNDYPHPGRIMGYWTLQ